MYCRYFQRMKDKKKLSIFILFFVVAISFIQHSPFINLDIQGIHSWRQSQTMWNIRNFVRHDNCILNPRINRFNGGKDNVLRYEFPLMQWCIAQCARVFGEEIKIVRISIFLIGLLSILAFTIIVKDIFDDWPVAMFSGILFLYSPVFYYYTINPIPDNLALAFSFIYVGFILKHHKSHKLSHLIFASIALMLSTLCKLPYLMFSILSIWFFLKAIFIGKNIISIFKNYALPQLILIIPAFMWYIWVIPSWTGNPILTGQLNEAFVIDEYLHLIYYHLTTMFPNILLSIPVWIITIIGLIDYCQNWRKHKWLFSLIGITFIYLILELKPIGTVHDYYMFPFLSWLYLLVAFGVSRILSFKYGYIGMIVFCVLSSVYTSVNTKQNWSVEKSYFNKDVFIYSEDLKNAVPHGEQCIILNDFTGYIFSYRIDKMGHVFHSDNLPIEWIDDLVRNYGIKYMYSDSRKVDELDGFQNYIDEVLIEKGTIKVFKLKLPYDNIK